ncbi:MAG: D-alanyl-D-alanine carboxypeptidase family protein [Solirubrobacteraceae bacterium]
MSKGSSGRGRRAGLLVALVALLATGAGSVAAAAPPPALSARAAILEEQSTGTAVYARAADRRLPIASTTKLMTALVTRERVPLRRRFAAVPYGGAAAESRLGLRPGERMSVADLLTAVMLPSANDAAYTLAVRVGGSVSRFVSLMNRRARSLGLRHTHYATPVGLDTPGNYSSARDLARLATVVRHDGFLRRTMDRRRALLRSGDRRRVVVNRNTLVGAVPWVDGVKTGHTLAAGYVLVGSGTRHGTTFISVVLGTPSEAARNADTLALLRWGFASFRVRLLGRRGGVVARPEVRFEEGRRVPVVAARTVRAVVRAGARVATAARVPGELEGPIPRGRRVGTLVASVNGRVVARIPAVTAEPVPEVTLLERAGRWALWPGTLIAGVALLAAAGAGLWRRGRRRRRRDERRARMRAASRPDTETA